MSDRIVIGGVETFSTVDFPEQISAVVFMQGCPLRCPFCYNQSLQIQQKSTDFDWEAFVNFLQMRKNVLDAVVFSGGEPLMQPALSDAIKQVKSMGYKIGLHTCGYNPTHLSSIIDLVDWVGLDIKAPLEDEKYQKATGVKIKAENVLSSLDILVNSGKDFECRTTCDPHILSTTDVYEIIKHLKSRGVKKYYLQKYRPVKNWEAQDHECEKFFTDREIKDAMEENFPTCGFRK